MGGKVVQLVQGREKVLEGGTPDEMIEEFSRFPEIQIVDLDAAIGQGSNYQLVERIASRAPCRVGGGVRTAGRAQTLIEQRARKVIVGTAAFQPTGINHAFLGDVAEAIGRQRVIVALDSREGRIVVRGWRESTELSAEGVLAQLEPYCGGFLCTYVDKEGMLQGTDLEWFRRLRKATSLELTAAGGICSLEEVRALMDMGVHAALGMAIYTGLLKLEDLLALMAAVPVSRRG